MNHLKRLSIGLLIFAVGAATFSLILGLGMLVMRYPVYAATVVALFVAYCVGWGYLSERKWSREERGNGVDW